MSPLDHHFSSFFSHCHNIVILMKQEKESYHYAQLALSICKRLILARNMIHPFPLFCSVQGCFQEERRTISSLKICFSPNHSMVLAQCDNLS